MSYSNWDGICWYHKRTMACKQSDKCSCMHTSSRGAIGGQGEKRKSWKCSKIRSNFPKMAWLLKKYIYIWLSYILTEKIRGSNSHGFLCSHESWKWTRMVQESWDSHAHVKTWNTINYKGNERCQHWVWCSDLNMETFICKKLVKFQVWISLRENLI